MLNKDKANSLEFNVSIVQDLATTNFSNLNYSSQFLPVPMPTISCTQKFLISSTNQLFYFDAASSIIENQKFTLCYYFKWDLSINPLIWEKAPNSYISKSNIFSDFYNAPYHLIVLYAFLILFARKIMDLANRDGKLNFQLIIIVGLTAQVYCITYDSGSFSYQNILCLSYCPTGNLQSFTTSTAMFIQDSVSGNVHVGHDSSGFTGFLWKLNIYNSNGLHLSDWRTVGCTSPCTKCSNNLSCPSDCPLNKYIYGSSCLDCMASCDKGCVSSDTCNLCKTKECATCEAFTGTDSCSTCITNAVSDGNGGCTCNTNAFWVSLTQSCEKCDVICSNCLKTAYFECSTCTGSYQLVGNVCLNGCPYEFGGSCLPVTTPVINNSFNIDFQGYYGILTTGTSSSSFQFFNTPESVDPIPAYMRGLYFDGSAYLLSSASILLYHSFSIGLWLYVTASGDILEKQTRLILSSSGVAAIMEDPTQAAASKTLSLGATLADWNYLSVTFAYLSGSTTITIYVNNVIASTLPVSKYIYRDLASTNLMIGKSSSSGFKGFINSFQLWNAPISSFSSYIIAVCGSGHACLWSCDLSHFWSGSSYISCNSCIKGCVRAGNCNICEDSLCLICTGFGSGKCTQCVSNASFIGTYCQCNSGYYWNDINESCELCDISCKSCASANWYDCLTCYSGYYMVLGICSSSCPSGYISSSGVCAFSHEKIFDLNLNTLNGIVYDDASLIPVITGSTKQFYPDYEADDPIPAYLRGFYFNGESSILRMPECSTYTLPKLVIAPAFTISIWLNIETADSAIFSKHNISDNYSTVYYISLIAGKPTISLLISSSAFFYMSQTSLNNYEWSHIVFTLEMNRAII
ncbi:unnamed protein product [Blepharisma stoltei]|uniref:TNFR-Cys domain-containing protein n=1 Tax=Blepharisma stoltei TaxID=1481888 RepID=A0AAU9KHK8_9CILI|nr:unnamed protein product [Blepharisma stoltei]